MLDLMESLVRRWSFSAPLVRNRFNLVWVILLGVAHPFSLLHMNPFAHMKGIGDFNVPTCYFG